MLLGKRYMCDSELDEISTWKMFQKKSEACRSGIFFLAI